MNIKALYCPHCGGNIKFDIDSGKRSCFCIHCGQQIIIDDGVQRTHHTQVNYNYNHSRNEIYDYAKIQETEFQEKKMNSENWLIQFYLWIVVFCLAIFAYLIWVVYTKF